MLVPLLLALAASPAAPDTVPGTLRGTVQSEPSGIPLPLAVVEVASGSRLLTTTADSAGRYQLHRIPAGRRLLVVRHPGHAPQELEILVPSGSDLVLDLSLRVQPVALDPVLVAAPELGDGEGGAARGRREDLGILQHTLEGSASAAAYATGGGSGTGGDGGEGGDVLYVRGSAADLKLVLLDGAPVYAPFHTGGLIQTFEPEALGSARLYLGGAPARLDGGLSYVMEMRTRPGRREMHRVSAGADLLSGRALVEGPLRGGGTYLVAARGVHGAAAERLQGEPFPYDYADALARADLPLRGGAEVGVTAFVNREGVRVEPGEGQGRALWGNVAGSARFRGTLGEVDVEATAALSDFSATLPWRASGNRTLAMLGGMSRARMAVDLASDAGRTRMRYGASFDRAWIRHRARLRDPQGGDSLLLDRRSAGDVGGWYLDATVPLAAWLQLRAGVRGDAFTAGPLLSLSPRVALTWLPAPRSSVTLAGGRYHQYVRTGREPGSHAQPTLEDSLRLQTRLTAARSTHLSLALDHEMGVDVRLGMEGYFKHFEGLPGTPEEGAHNSGVDLWVRRGGAAVTGWLGYSLAWSWAADGEGMAGDFAGRQLVSAGMEAPLGHNGRFGLKVAYGAGLPYTAVYSGAMGVGESVLPPTSATGVEDGTGAPLTGPPQEPYLRVDAELSRTFSPRWGGRVTQLTPYVRILNALDRRDSVFYRLGWGDTGPRAVAALPVLPVAGLSWKF